VFLRLETPLLSLPLPAPRCAIAYCILHMHMRYAICDVRYEQLQLLATSNYVLHALVSALLRLACDVCVAVQRDVLQYAMRVARCERLRVLGPSARTARAQRAACAARRWHGGASAGCGWYIVQPAPPPRASAAGCITADAPCLCIFAPRACMS
jgi:hypothetical protein